MEEQDRSDKFERRRRSALFLHARRRNGGPMESKKSKHNSRKTQREWSLLCEEWEEGQIEMFEVDGYVVT